VADSKISALPAASAALGTDELPINEAGASKKLTVAQIQSLITTATSGSTLPTQPAYGNNRPFFYNGETVYYDGTRWLGLLRYLTVPPTAATSSTFAASLGDAFGCALPDEGILLYADRIIANDSSANNNPMCWDIPFYVIAPSGGGAVGGLSTLGTARSSFIVVPQFGTWSPLVLPAGAKAVSIGLTRNASAGPITVFPMLEYRPIYT
jgi:hypothetical protein